MNQPRYFAGEFDDDKRLNPAFTLLIVLAIAFLFLYAAFWAGGMFERARAEDAAKRAPPAPHPTVLKADWTQFDCRELANICRKRYEAKR